MTRGALIVLLFLAGCAVPTNAPPAVGLVPDATGLQPNGTPLRIDFWRDRDGVIAAVTRLKGQPPEAREIRENCGELVRWKDGLQLTFIAGDFRGWAQNGALAGVVCR